MTSTVEDHKQYLTHRRPLSCDLSSLPPLTVQLIERYGHWMAALATGRLEPTTPAQLRFLQVNSGQLPPVTPYELAWRHYQGQRVFERAKELDASVDKYGYEQTVKLFSHAARLGVAAASDWLIAEGRHVPNECFTTSLAIPDVQVPVSRHLDLDDTGYKLDTRASLELDWSSSREDLDGAYWESMFGGPRDD